MLTKEWALEFATDWVESWNAHDLDRVLSHYTDDFEMSSPYIVKFTADPSGTLRGKDAVGAYWQVALQRIPDLRFELIDVFVSVCSLTILYKAALGRTATEVFFFNEQGQAYKAVAHYDD